MCKGCPETLQLKSCLIQTAFLVTESPNFDGLSSLAINTRDISEARLFTNHRGVAYVICTGLAEISLGPKVPATYL